MSVVGEGNIFISVVLPCYNEEENIGIVIEDIAHYLKKFKKSEIIVVDDGSTDNTFAILHDLKEKIDNLKIVQFEQNFGLSAALHAGCVSASGEILVTMDADRQYKSTGIDALLSAFDGTNVVCGYRLHRGDGIIKKISSKIANIMGDFITGDRVKDSGCLLRLFPKKVTQEINCFNGFHRFFATLCRIKGYSVCEVGVEHFPRKAGVSKFNIRNRLFVAMFDAFAVRHQRLRELRYKINEKKSSYS